MQKDFLEVKSLYRKSEDYIGKKVCVAGWIRTARISKSFGFIELNDGSFFKNIQIVVDENKLDNFKDISKLAIRSEEHTSELQSRQYLVCRLLLEKKKSSIEFHLTLTATIMM